MKSAQMQKCTFHFVEFFVPCRSPGHDDYIFPIFQYILIQSKAFSDKPDKPVPHNAVADFFTDRDSYPRVMPARIHHVHHQVSVCIGLSFPVDLLKIPVFFQRIESFHQKLPNCGQSMPICKKRVSKSFPNFRILSWIRQADNLALPFALLAANTFLPPALLILALKP